MKLKCAHKWKMSMCCSAVHTAMRIFRWRTMLESTGSRTSTCMAADQRAMCMNFLYCRLNGGTAFPMHLGLSARVRRGTSTGCGMTRYRPPPPSAAPELAPLGARCTTEDLPVEQMRCVHGRVQHRGGRSMARTDPAMPPKTPLCTPHATEDAPAGCLQTSALHAQARI